MDSASSLLYLSTDVLPTYLCNHFLDSWTTWMKSWLPSAPRQIDKPSLSMTVMVCYMKKCVSLACCAKTFSENVARKDDLFSNIYDLVDLEMICCASTNEINTQHTKS